jgi:DNA-binding LacI/PurR family transcriptional regulator
MAGKKRVRIVDIAKAAGVSPATVSRLLNQKEGEIKVSNETRHKILTAIETLGYERALISSILSADKTGIISAVNRNVGGTFMSRLAHAVQVAAHERNVEVLIGSTRPDTGGIEAQLAMLQGQLFDGFLLLGDLPGYDDMIERLATLEKPHVSVGGGAKSAPPRVSIDEAAGVSMMLDYLRGLGHRRIVLLGHPRLISFRERITAFHEDYAQHDPANWDPTLLVNNDNYRHLLPDAELQVKLHPSAALAAQRIMQGENPPTAIMCVADGYAAAVIKGLRQIGIQVPDDVSVAGFDDSPEAVVSEPEITTIRQPISDLAQRAVNLLLDLVEDPTRDDVERLVVVQPELILRASCAKPGSN